jgi:hypothetical protein
LFDPSDPQHQDGVGDISGVRIRNVNVHGPTPTTRGP